MTLIDTGVRIDEALNLQRPEIDFDNLLIEVKGKGQKSRLVPFSNELRKVLWKWMKKHDHKYVFPVRDGGRMRYRNFLRDLKDLCIQLGIEGLRTSPHSFR